MCAQTPLLVINQPKKIGDRWLITGRLHTPYGVIELRADGSELLAKKAIERMHGEAMEVAGIFDDIRGAVARIAKSKAFKQVFADAFEQQVQDMLDYGCPHLGSRTVIERFTKQDGLVVLRRPFTSDTLMISSLE